MDTAEDLWHLEGTQVRMVLPLQCSHFLSCPSVALKKGKGSLRGGKRRALPLSHEVWRRPPCFLNSLSEESLSAAG